VLDPEERHVYAELLDHGRAVRDEREQAVAAGREPDFARFVKGWGGVTIAYRKRLQDSPAYRLNHEEVIKALEEGIWFAECLSPTECVIDERGHATALRFEVQEQTPPVSPPKGGDKGGWRGTGKTVELP